MNDVTTDLDYGIAITEIISTSNTKRHSSHLLVPMGSERTCEICTNKAHYVHAFTRMTIKRLRQLCELLEAGLAEYDDGVRVQFGEHCVSRTRDDITNHTIIFNFHRVPKCLHKEPLKF